MTRTISKNHPAKGSKITVEPIRNLDHINSIKQFLASKPRDLLLFTLGINNGIRTGDLLRIKVQDLTGKKAGDTISIKESKTGKTNVLMINKAVHKVLTAYLASEKPLPEHYLFRSRTGLNMPLTVQTVNRMVKGWARAINLPGNYGAHTLRKTFGYVQRTHYGVGFEVLCKRFNHGSPTVTMRYLGITDAEVTEILQNEV
jgi:integrase